MTKAHRYDPDLNPTYYNFALHCGFGIVPAHFIKKQQKHREAFHVHPIRAVLGRPREFSLTDNILDRDLDIPDAILRYPIALLRAVADSEIPRPLHLGPYIEDRSHRTGYPAAMSRVREATGVLAYRTGKQPWLSIERHGISNRTTRAPMTDCQTDAGDFGRRQFEHLYKK